MITAVQANTALLLNFGAGQKANAATGIAWRIERFFRSVAEKTANDPSTIETHLPMMGSWPSDTREVGCCWHASMKSQVWKMGQKRRKVAGGDILEDVVMAEEARFAWFQVARLCHSTKDWIGEIHATVELCSLDGATTEKSVMVKIAGTMSSSSRRCILRATNDNFLGRRLLQLFEQNSGEANATDFFQGCMGLVGIT